MLADFADLGLVKQKKRNPDKWKEDLGRWYPHIKSLPWQGSMMFDLDDYLKSIMTNARKISLLWKSLAKEAKWQGNILKGTMLQRFAKSQNEVCSIVRHDIGSFVFAWCQIVIDDSEHRKRPSFRFYNLNKTNEIFDDELKSGLYGYTQDSLVAKKIYQELQNLLP